MEGAMIQHNYNPVQNKDYDRVLLKELMILSSSKKELIEIESSLESHYSQQTLKEYKIYPSTPNIQYSSTLFDDIVDHNNVQIYSTD